MRSGVRRLRASGSVSGLFLYSCHLGWRRASPKVLELERASGGNTVNDHMIKSLLKGAAC